MQDDLDTREQAIRWSGGPLQALLALCVFLASFGVSAGDHLRRATTGDDAERAHAVFVGSLATARTPARVAWREARLPHRQKGAQRPGKPGVDARQGR